MSTSSDFLTELTPAQYTAVTACDRPSLVIAGAGSGKTRVLTYKIAYLITQGYQPYNILALTFTNKAAHEMQERISRQVGLELASQLWMGTFHSIFARILHIECATLGYTSDFTIYDTDDTRSLLKTIVREMQLDDKQYRPATVASHISQAKNALITPSDYERDPQLRRRDQSLHLPLISTIYRHYVERCRQSNAMDFDDLLLHTYNLLRDNEALRLKYQERFRYILVDEYQDTNYAQHQIIRLLADRHHQLTVVGDDAQSIYSFRGANIDNILQFRQHFPEAQIYKLEQNFRSTQHIVAAANSLISNNPHQIPKELYSQNTPGSPVHLTPTYSDTDEAHYIVRTLQQYNRTQHISLSQIAILYRTNAQSRSFEDSLRQARVPYRIYGSTSFYQRKEVKDTIAYLRLIVNPLDEEALRRIINYPARGIGQTTLQHLQTHALQQSVPLWETLLTPPQEVGTAARRHLADFHNLIDTLHRQAPQTDAYTLALQAVVQSGLRDDIMRGTAPEDISRQQNLQELLDGISAFVSERSQQDHDILLTHYLQEVSLLSDLDQDPTDTDQKVTLMTIHSAKGLEFDLVFVAGLEENLLPSEMSLQNPRQIEEERRLLYVAITRARLHLHLTYARSRFRYGHIEYGRPSRFLNELNLRPERPDGHTASTPSRPHAPKVRLASMRPLAAPEQEPGRERARDPGGNGHGNARKESEKDREHEA